MICTSAAAPAPPAFPRFFFFFFFVPVADASSSSFFHEKKRQHESQTSLTQPLHVTLHFSLLSPPSYLGSFPLATFPLVLPPSFLLSQYPSLANTSTLFFLSLNTLPAHTLALSPSLAFCLLGTIALLFRLKHS